MTKSMKRIHKVTVKRIEDESPDTSYLGTFSDKADTEFAIDHRERSGQGNNVLQWFNPQCNDNADDAEADYKRMMQLENGEFCYIGIRAEAEVLITIHGVSDGAHDVIQRITSGGLWGIESDSDAAYLAEIEQEQLSELRDQLHAIGFSNRAISAAMRDIKHENV